MKKIIYLIAAIFATTLVACSSDDDNSGSDLVLPKTLTYNEGEYTEIFTFTYNGNKIVESKSEDAVTKYTYTGDNITNIKYYEKDNTGVEVLEIEQKYTYEDDKLATDELFNGDYGSKTIYTHNSDGTIEYTRQYSSGNSSGGKITIKDGNMVKKEEYNEDGSVSYSQTFEYDDKNSPYVNVLGMDKLLDDLESVSKNNVIKRTTNYGTGTFEYEYNDKGYPTKKTELNNDGKVSDINEYTY